MRAGVCVCVCVMSSQHEMLRKHSESTSQKDMSYSLNLGCVKRGSKNGTILEVVKRGSRSLEYSSYGRGLFSR